MLARCIDQELKSSALPSRDGEGIERGVGCRTFLLADPYQPLLQRRVGARRHLRVRFRLLLRLGGGRSPFPLRRHRVGSAAPRAGEWMRGGEIWGRENPPALEKGKFSNRSNGQGRGGFRCLREVRVFFLAAWGPGRVERPPSSYGRPSVRATGSKLAHI
jgi:hypothetical protein